MPAEDDHSVGTLYYFGDPMCSWCWGLKPVLEQVDGEYPELRRVTVMGGLRAGAEEPMSDELASLIQQAWMRIEDSTGQPFDHRFWEQHRPLATTLPACRAVVAARLLDPEREWPMMVGLFGAYFTRCMDPSRRETHVQVAGEVGFAPRRFEAMLDDPHTEQALQDDLRTTKHFGITGFPTVVMAVRGEYYLVAPGYQPIEVMRRAINAVYEKTGISYTRPESGLYS